MAFSVYGKYCGWICMWWIILGSRGDDCFDFFFWDKRKALFWYFVHKKILFWYFLQVVIGECVFRLKLSFIYFSYLLVQYAQPSELPKPQKRSKVVAKFLGWSVPSSLSCPRVLPRGWVLHVPSLPWHTLGAQPQGERDFPYLQAQALGLARSSRPDTLRFL